MTAIRFLLVDDNEDGVEALASLLEDEGHETQIALTAKSALAMFELARPEVVVVDIGLPDMDGFDLAVEMRRRFGNDFRLVAFTGYDKPELRQRALGCGINAFVTKPFKPTTLDALIGKTSKPDVAPPQPRT